MTNHIESLGKSVLMVLIGLISMWGMGFTSSAAAQEPGELARLMVGGPEVERAHPELEDRFAMMKHARITDFYRREASKEFFDEEAYWLALNMYHEARGEGRHGMRMVAFITLNRVKNRHYPDAIEKVVRQRKKVKGVWKCQFSWYCDDLPDQPADLRQFVEIVRLAEYMMTQFQFDPTDQSIWYHADYVSPVWARNKQPVGCIGKHCYYNDIDNVS